MTIFCCWILQPLKDYVLFFHIMRKLMKYRFGKHEDLQGNIPTGHLHEEMYPLAICMEGELFSHMV